MALPRKEKNKTWSATATFLPRLTGDRMAFIYHHPVGINVDVMQHMVAREGLYLRLAGVGGMLYLLHTAHSPHPWRRGMGKD